MTKERYIALAIETIASLLLHEGHDVFTVPVEEAWNAFVVVLARDPHCDLGLFYYAYGMAFRAHFGLLWPAFQGELARRCFSGREVC